MMKAEVGASVMVTGSSSAMVSAGPMPGRMPMAVPSIEPISAHIRFVGCRATAKPWSSRSKVCMALDSQRREEPPQLQAELREQDPGEAAEDGADGEIEQQPTRAEGAGHQGEGEHGSEGQPHGPHQQHR